MRLAIGSGGERGAEPEFFLNGSGGYGIVVSGDHGRLDVDVIGDRASTVYSVSEERLDGSLGDLGKVSARFHPSGKVRWRRVPKRCEGKPEITHLGVFAGTIRFRGEQGYTEVNTRGSVRYPAVLRCRSAGRRAWASRSPSAPTFLAWQPFGEVLFEASAEGGPKAAARFSARTRESRGSLTVFRGAYTSSAPSGFSFDPTFNSATIEPPAPFSGSGTFTRLDDNASRWEGSLTVSFLGHENVPLTGRDFSRALGQ